MQNTFIVTRASNQRVRPTPSARVPDRSRPSKFGASLGPIHARALTAKGPVFISAYVLTGHHLHATVWFADDISMWRQIGEIWCMMMISKKASCCGGVTHGPCPVQPCTRFRSRTRTGQLHQCHLALNHIELHISKTLSSTLSASASEFYAFYGLCAAFSGTVSKHWVASARFFAAFYLRYTRAAWVAFLYSYVCSAAFVTRAISEGTDRVPLI